MAIQIGDVFGRLKVIGLDEEKTKQHKRKRGYRKYWFCECSCEEHNIVSVSSDNLQNGSTKSCGCIKREKAKNSKKESNKPKRTKEDFKNIFDLDSYEYGVGWTKQGDMFLFDKEDKDIVIAHNWYTRTLPSGYKKPETKIKGKYYSMAQVVKGNWQDHINRNPFDNRKENLRDTNYSTNTMNTGVRKNNKTGITGVQKTHYNTWAATIGINNRNKWLGTFKTKEEAIIARLKAEKEHFGEFAPQKELFEKYGI